MLILFGLRSRQQYPKAPAGLEEYCVRHMKYFCSENSDQILLNAGSLVQTVFIKLQHLFHNLIINYQLIFVGQLSCKTHKN